MRCSMSYGALLGDRRDAGSADRFAIVGVDERQERLRRAVEGAERHAEDAMRLGGPSEAVGSVELGHPAADVRDFLRLLEKLPMLLERFG